VLRELARLWARLDEQMDLARMSERVGLHERAHDSGELAQYRFGGVLDVVIVHSENCVQAVPPAPAAGSGTMRHGSGRVKIRARAGPL
jgi:hypothetical protein